MLVAPGPIDVVQAIMRRRRLALAKAMAACAMPCSLWARKVGKLSRAPCSASPMPDTLPWPKMAHMPAKSGTRAPSTSVICAPR